MNSTIYYIPEAKAQPNFHLNQSNYQQGQNQSQYHQNQSNYHQSQFALHQSQSHFYQNQNQSNFQQSQLNFSHHPNYQQNQYNYQQSQSNLPPQNPQNQSNFYQNQSPPSQPFNFHQSQLNYSQVQPNNIQQSTSSFTPSEFHYSQQANPNLYQSFNPEQSQNQSKYPQLEQIQPTFQQEQPNVLLNSFAAPPKTNLPPANMLANIRANKFGIAIDIIGENSYKEDGVKFTLYKIQGFTTRKGEFSTAKGYKDFVNIHLTLINRFPGSAKYLCLPDKTLFLKLDDGNLQAKRDGLATFLKTAACSTDIFFSADFQNFLFTGPAPAKQQLDFLKQQNQAESVSITIVQQFLKQDLITSHIEYLIIGKDSKGDFKVNRRYSDFVLIREVLVGKFPKVPFTHLPGVTSSGAERSNGLIAFLKSIPKIPFAYNSVEWQTFIRYTGPDLKKKLKPFKKSKNLLEVLF